MTSATYSEYFWVKNETSSSGIVTIKKNNAGAPTVTVEYSTDGTTWTTKGSTSTTSMIFTLAANSKIYLRATADCWSDLSLGFYYNYFSSGMSCSVGGNIMSLLWGSSFVVNNVVKKTFPNEDIQGILNGLFVNWANLVNAGELVLPVTHIESTSGQMGNRCYRAMFNGCSNLVNGPHIDLRRENNQAPVAFQVMFSGCTSLQNVTINTQYGADTNMFQNVATNGVLFNQSGTDYSGILPSTWTQNNVISLYFGYDRVTNWVRNNIEVDKVVDENSNVIIWEKPIDPKYFEPFYFKNNGSTVKTLNWNPSQYALSIPEVTIYYSTDNVTYSSVVIQDSTFTIDIQPNTKLYIKSVLNFSKSYESGSPKWSDEIGGNIASLFYGLDFTGREQYFPKYYDEDEEEWKYYEHIASYMFSWSNITTAENLYLLKMDNTFCAYSNMFYHCTSLTTPPALPAITLADGCYNNMFSDCTSLTQAPALPATTLVDSCYEGMFYNCTSLTQTPSILPATLPKANCYASMFNGCTSLVSSPEIMLTSFYKNGNNYYFYSCINMFSGCSSLSSIKIHATEWPTSDYPATNNWVNNVAANGTFYKPALLPTQFGSSRIPSGWTVAEV